MTLPRPIAATDHPAWLLVTALVTASGVLLLLLLPLTGAVLLPLALVMPLGWYWVARRKLPPIVGTELLAVLLVAGLYFLANALWSSNQGYALHGALTFIMTVLTTYVVTNALRQTETAVLRAMTFGFVWGVGLGAVVLLFEIGFDHPFRRTLTTVFPWLLSQKRLALADPVQRHAIHLYELNRSIAALGLLLWPALLAARAVTSASLRRGLLVPLAAIALTVIFASDYGSAKAGFAGAAVAFYIAGFSAQWAFRSMAVAWMAAVLLVVPIVTVLAALHAERAPWLPHSAQARVLIWSETASLIRQAPVFGAGIGAARLEGRELAGSTGAAPAVAVPLGPHAHNAFLQVWQETGLAGALLMLAAGLLGIRRIADVRPMARPFAYAMFAASAITAAFSFSIWAPWYLAAFGLACVFLRLATETEARLGSG